MTAFCPHDRNEQQFYFEILNLWQPHTILGPVTFRSVRGNALSISLSLSLIGLEVNILSLTTESGFLAHVLYYAVIHNLRSFVIQIAHPHV